MGNFIAIILDTTGEFLGDVEDATLNTWLETNGLRVVVNCGHWISVE
jgi:hypothetical protein